mmetsp:Transcript_14830/g.45294  ORF Transcript_14830/g.45294 Transcript_14830/m.45294 type:complete len:201 (-) Transcript_14830:697-1299(-)
MRQSCLLSGSSCAESALRLIGRRPPPTSQLMAQTRPKASRTTRSGLYLAWPRRKRPKSSSNVSSQRRSSSKPTTSPTGSLRSPQMASSRASFLRSSSFSFDRSAWRTTAHGPSTSRRILRARSLRPMRYFHRPESPSMPEISDCAGCARISQSYMGTTSTFASSACSLECIILACSIASWVARCTFSTCTHESALCFGRA